VYGRPKDLLGQHGGDDRVDAVCLHLARADRGEHPYQAVKVHRLVAAVDEGLAHDRVIGDLDRPRDVLLTGR